VAAEEKSGWLFKGAVVLVALFVAFLVLLSIPGDKNQKAVGANVGGDKDQKAARPNAGGRCDPDGDPHAQCGSEEICIIRVHTRSFKVLGPDIRTTMVPSEALGWCKPAAWFCEQRCEFDKSRSDWLQSFRPSDPDAGHFTRVWGSLVKCVNDCKGRFGENKRKN
jgi:hypothetical protein